MNEHISLEETKLEVERLQQEDRDKWIQEQAEAEANKPQSQYDPLKDPYNDPVRAENRQKFYAELQERYDELQKKVREESVEYTSEI